MAKIKHAASLAEALKGADHVIFLAPAGALADGLATKVLKGKWARLAGALAGSIEKPGPMGALATTLTGESSPSRLTIGSLPDEVSRWLSTSRNLAVENCLAKVELPPGTHAAVIVAVDEPGHVLAVANAVGRSRPLFDGRSGRRKAIRMSFLAVDRSGKALDRDRSAQVVSEAARWAAELVDTPTADLTTADFVERTAAECKSLKTVAMSVIEGDELLENGLNGLHAVGRTAMVAPRLLILRYEPTTPEEGPHVALVGKGLVYDTGGLSLKVGGSMPGMKCDMGGAAAVVGAFLSLVRTRYPRKLSCLVGLAENAIGPDAYRPDDILRMHSGKTVEVNNTDAEGRIVLADAVSWAAREIKADCIMDAATLTGAQLVATGKRHAAIFSNRAGLEQACLEAGLVSGDAVCALPFAPELYQAELKSDVADMMNSVRDRMNAQSSCAAQFIWAHIADTNVPWLHVDLAGPAKPGPHGSGYGVGLFTELLYRLEAGDLKA